MQKNYSHFTYPGLQKLHFAALPELSCKHACCVVNMNQNSNVLNLGVPTFHTCILIFKDITQTQNTQTTLNSDSYFQHNVHI